MNLSGITWQGQWHRFLWTETASRCSYLRPALQTAPLWSEKDIFEVQFEVNIHPRHSDRPERGWVSPETGWCSQWSRAPGTKPEPAEEQRIYSGERAVTAQAPMALFGKACTFSPSLSLSPLSTSPLRLHSVWSGSSSSSDVFPMWLPGTHKHTHTHKRSHCSSALQYVHRAPAVQLRYCSSESMSDLMGNEREGGMLRKDMKYSVKCPSVCDVV